MSGVELHPSRIPVLRHVIAVWRLVRRWLSRREFTVRLLGLSVSEGTADEPGVILLQIDGLSRVELERALKKGRMPFVSQLLRRERHHLHTLYSGQPATTPAVLGELFYGERQAVPAFSFRDHRSGKIVEMVEPEIATTIQDELAAKGAGLLSGGSAYCDIYSGGAAESQFCPGSMRWDAIDDAAVWKKAALLVLNVATVFRIIGLLAVEFAIGLFSAVRSRTGRREWKHELLFVPRRMFGNVVVRETTAIAVEADATRGLPVIHANFLGYDELAHRRGPGSHYAHRALPDIDRALRRIWNAAQGSRRRAYRVWVMSDHGQETTDIYDQRFSRSVADAVTAVYRSLEVADAKKPGGGEDPHGADQRPAPTVVAIGPLGYVYWPETPNDDVIEYVAPRLISECGIPLVMARCRGQARAWTPNGTYRMPDEADCVLAPHHPFLSETAADITALLDHPDAGEFLISGWSNQDRPMSFVAEHGAHAGPGPTETSGFVLLSPDVRPLDRTLRPVALRELVQNEVAAAAPRDARQWRPSDPLRIVTYNVHSCIGLDGRLSPRRIVRVLAELAPDVIALQELDVCRQRTGCVDQAAAIAEALQMELLFYPSLEVTEERYGNAILSRLKMDLVKAERFSVLSARHEPRGALWVKIDAGDQTYDVITTHLGLTRAERDEQIGRLLGSEWLGHPECGSHAILCGDLNASPRSAVYGRVRHVLQDAQIAGGRRRPNRTWCSSLPLTCLDYVFVSQSIEVVEARVVNSGLARVASDHLPVLVAVRPEEAATSNPTRRTRDSSGSITGHSASGDGESANDEGPLLPPENLLLNAWDRPE